MASRKRADIWAYGAVLFEMLTGRRLFEAGDVSEVLAAVLVKELDISGIGTHVPSHVRSVVRQCLVKGQAPRVPLDVRSTSCHLAPRGVISPTLGPAGLPSR